MRYLTQSEKRNTRRLYEYCFPEDTQKFVDYYYREKCRDNDILVMEDSGKIVSMVHANPFAVSFCKNVAKVHYIVAVATDQACRRLGYMRRLMQQILKDCCDRGEPFSFLMPANPAYYEPLGYRYWNGQYVWEIPKEQECILETYCAGQNRNPGDSGMDEKKRSAVSEMASENGFVSNEERQGKKMSEELQMSKEMFSYDPTDLAKRINKTLEEQFDLYILRDASYYERIEKEQESEDGGVCPLYNLSGALSGSFFYSMEDGFEIREPVLADSMPLPGQKDGFLAVTERKEPLMMGRITDLEAFVRCLRFAQTYEEVLQIRDDILPENNGIFRIYIDKTGGRAERAEACENARAMDIATFGQLMFDRLRIFVNELV